jgi:hypothetical protein
LPTPFQGTGFGPIGEKTDVPNAHKATGQNMPQEAANKLDCL